MAIRPSVLTPGRRLLSNIVLLATTFGLTLLIGEAVARFVFRHSLDFDMEMWKYATQIEVVSEDPRLGHDQGPNRSALLMGVNFTTNRFGLRGRETTTAKPVNTYRIVVLGDSNTAGWGVEQERIFVSDLERRMNADPPAGFPRGVHYETLNLGVGNYNTVQEVTRLGSLGLRFAPDLILLAYYINDAEPLFTHHTNYLIEHSYLDAWVASRLGRMPFAGVGALNYKDYYRGLYASDQPGWLSAQEALHDLAALAHDKRIPVVMYLIPELHDLSSTYPFHDINRAVMSIGVDVGLPVVDLFPIFSGYSPEVALWVTPKDVHPNALGHSMIAKGIYDSLASARAAAGIEQ